MEERLGFELDIDVHDDKVPAAARAVDDLGNKLYRAGKAVEQFEKVWKDSSGRWRDARGRFLGAGQEVDQFGNKLSGVSSKMSATTSKIVELSSALSILRTGLGAASSVYNLFDKGTSYAITAMGERSATVRGYTQLLGGDKRQANLEFYRAQEFSQKTDFTSEQIEKSQARLLAQGFRGKELYSSLFSAADLAAIMPGDKNQTLERVTMAMSQIKAKGRLQGEELTQQLGEAGLNTTLVKQQLAKALGIKVGDVDKKISAGEVGADVALPAIQRAIMQQLGTSRAGEYATSSAGSLTALISNRDEAVKNLLKSFDADENLPALARYKTALKEQGALFDVNARTGKQLSLVLQDLSNTGLEAKSAWAEFTNGFLDSFADSYTRQLNKDGRNFDAESTTRAMHNLGEAIGRLGTVAALAVGGTEGLTATLAQRGANIANGLAGFAEKVQKGDYAGAASDAASGYKQTLPWLVMKNSPLGRVAGSLYDRYGHKDTLESAESFDMSGRYSSRALASARSVPKVSKADQAAARLDAAAKAGKAAPYAGVFWGYDFNGGAGQPFAGAKPAQTLHEIIEGVQRQSAAVTMAAAARQPAPQENHITINGYNRDKVELAQEIATVLSRLTRSAA